MVEGIKTKLVYDLNQTGLPANIKLKYYTDGTNAFTSGPYEKDMVDSISIYKPASGTYNSPISFELVNSANSSDQKINTRNYHIQSSNIAG
jgi:hypothetical protein